MAKQLPAYISIEELGKRMAALDLTNVPPEKKKIAILDHLMKIQEETLVDREAASKIGSIRRFVHSKASQYDSPIILPKGYKHHN